VEGRTRGRRKGEEEGGRGNGEGMEKGEVGGIAPWLLGDRRHCLHAPCNINVIHGYDRSMRQLGADADADDANDDVTVTLRLPAGDGVGGVLRHGVHRAAVVSRLPQ